MKLHTLGRYRRLGAALLGATVLITGSLFAVGSSVLTADATGTAPCDIYLSGSTPCVAAFSTTRALYGSYNGALYEVQRASDGTKTNVSTLSAGGYANAATQDTFCATSACTITTIYDQSANHNDLTPSPAGQQGVADGPADAKALPITIGASHTKVYGVYMPPQIAYRRSSTVTTGTARGANAESMYEVASGTNVNNGCCSDFGNVETDTTDDGRGTMDTINLSTLNGTGSFGYGPWVQNDLENGVWQGQTAINTSNHGNSSKFVTAMTKNNGHDTFALKGGDSQAGALSTWWEGALPLGVDDHGFSYYPMRLEGSIELGAGGDNSNRGTQSFFEGVMTSGYATTATENAIQQNIVAQNYQGVSTGGGPGWPIVGPGNKCVDVSGDDVGVTSSGQPAQVQLWDCQALAADQHLLGSAYGVGTLGTLGKCISTVGGGQTNGTHIQLSTCNGSAGQQWLPQPDGSIKNPGSGLCLDDPSGNTANGTPLQLFTCNGAAAQKFSSTVPIHLPNNKCVDVDGSDYIDSNVHPVQVFDCQTIFTDAPQALDQQWSYNPTSQHVTSSVGRCLDAANGGTTAGTAVQSYLCIGGSAQQWVPRSDGSILNPASNLCLDDPSGNTANGTHLQLWYCNGASAQAFRFN